MFACLKQREAVRKRSLRNDGYTHFSALNDESVFQPVICISLTIMMCFDCVGASQCCSGQKTGKSRPMKLYWYNFATLLQLYLMEGNQCSRCK